MRLNELSMRHIPIKSINVNRKHAFILIGHNDVIPYAGMACRKRSASFEYEDNIYMVYVDHHLYCRKPTQDCLSLIDADKYDYSIGLNYWGIFVMIIASFYHCHQ